MKLLLLLLSLAYSMAVAGVTHGGIREDEQEGKSQDGGLKLESGDTIFVPGKGGGDDDKTGKKEKKQTAPSAQVTVPGPGRPLFIFANDPLDPRRPKENEGALLSEEMKKQVKAKVPGAGMLETGPVTADSISEVYLKALKTKPLEMQAVSSAILIVNTDATWNSGNGLSLVVRAGAIPQKVWESAVEKLSASIFGSGIRDRLETILLTSFAGEVDCRKLPGSVFGMAPAGVSRDLANVTLWNQMQRQRAEMPFPTTAREWFETWGVTNKISRRKYFICPVKNAKGYLGYKTKKDPIDDNAGVEWDINAR